MGKLRKKYKDFILFYILFVLGFGILIFGAVRMTINGVSFDIQGFIVLVMPGAIISLVSIILIPYFPNGFENALELTFKNSNRKSMKIFRVVIFFIGLVSFLLIFGGCIFELTDLYPKDNVWFRYVVSPGLAALVLVLILTVEYQVLYSKNLKKFELV